MQTVFQGLKSIAFEGATANNFETDFTVTDPTADRTITFPDESGAVAFQQVQLTQLRNINYIQNELKSVVSLILYNSSGTPVKTTLYGSA